MDVSHGKSFLDCAISGSPISQMTIMHAYQTCIKRVVRFANSLQVTKEMETVHYFFLCQITRHCLEQ